MATCGNYGGSYGGEGGAPTYSCHGPVYGSYNAPINLGSGGNATAGGGAVILNVTNALTVNGIITADATGTNNTGIGSGGSIYINAGSLIGAGTLSAQGLSTNNLPSGGGGGGRIAVIASTSSFSGSYQAYGGTGNPSTVNAAAGTIFIKTPGNTGTLIVDNASHPNAGGFYTKMSSADYSSSFDQIQLNHVAALWMPYPSTFTITSGGNVFGDGTADEFKLDGLLNSPAALTVSSYTLTISSYSTAPSATSLNIGYAGIFNLGGISQTPIANVSTITIQNNGMLTHWPNSTTALGEQHKLNLTLSSMTIQSGGSISVVGKGYAAANGPGIGSCSNYGGSYGGEGGAPTSNCRGSVYGSYSAPVNLGSGGVGLAGGGAVILNITNALTVSGSIVADATSGNAAGVGSGGSIYITAGSLVGAGTLSAQGDSCVFSPAGGGGGGRIAVIASTSGYSGSYQANGGTGSNGSIYNAGAGTIFIKTPANPHGNLIVDNASHTNGGGFYTKMLSADYSSSFDQVQLNHAGGLWLAYPSTFTISGNNFVVDGTAGDEFRPDGLLNTPAGLTVSSYTLTISSFSTVPSATSLTIGYAGTFNLGGTSQTPIANVSTITIQNNGVLTHWTNSTTALGEQHKLNLSLSSMTILAGGLVNVVGKGYSAANGPGIGSCGNYGGSYGGEGGDPTYSCRGPAYGSYSAPTNIGSGGNGSAGGGAVILNVTNALTVSGGIMADATSLPNSGIGSGGSIYINAGLLVGTGTLSAQGLSTVFGAAGGGGGGRIALIASTSGFSGNYQA